MERTFSLCFRPLPVLLILRLQRQHLSEQPRSQGLSSLAPWDMKRRGPGNEFVSVSFKKSWASSVVSKFYVVMFLLTSEFLDETVLRRLERV